MTETRWWRVVLAVPLLAVVVAGCSGTTEYRSGNGELLDGQTFLNDVAGDIGRDLSTEEAVALTVWNKMVCSEDSAMTGAAEDSIDNPKIVSAARKNLDPSTCNV